jgi:hypothetical protein
VAEQPFEKPVSAEASGTGEQKAVSSTAGPLTVKPGTGFTIAGLVDEAMSILCAIDAVPASTVEIAAVAQALKMATVPGLDQPLLTARAARIPNLTVGLAGVLDGRYSGTDGQTTLWATVGSVTEPDSGFAAGDKFPGLINPVEKLKRPEVRFRLTVRIAQAKFLHLYQNGTAPALGDWVETLAHEFCLHADAHIDGIVSYLAGEPWPGQLEKTQHWLFLRRGVPRYLLWLNRLRSGAHKDLMPSVEAAARSWAGGQANEQPAAIAAVLRKTAELTHLRELASVFHLPAPDEKSAAATQDILAGLVRTLPDQQKLWWWPT